MRHLPVVAVVASLCYALNLEPVRAATPLGTGFTYQGQLKQSGTPVNGTANLLFSLWDAVSGPNQVGSTQTLNGVSVTGGLFTVTLNAGGEFGVSAFNSDKHWLEISVNGITLAPRQELAAAPNAFFALNADRLDGLDSTAFLQSIPVPLTLSGASASSHIIRGENSSTIGSASGVLGLSTAGTGATFGLYGESSSTNGTGVYGRAAAASGLNYGGHFDTFSTSGRGVFGQATAATGVTYGVYGLSASSSDNAVGVLGQATGASGFTFGGRFECASTSGIGVFGFSYPTSGATVGVYGRSDSTSGTGIYGIATATSGFSPEGPPTYGVYGRSDGGGFGTSGVVGIATAAAGGTRGVYGRCDSSTSGIGVYGEATATSSTFGTYGVYGYTANTTVTGYAVYANGTMGASGVKSFRIDHPDDPENKYLLHYSVESPEVLNAYSGKVTLDGAGRAVVELPHYFAKINKDPRYTLTAVGAPMPMLHVAEEIDEAALSAGAKAGPGTAATMCSFRIAGGAPGKKVSWRVEALRNDKWVQQRAEPVEVEKQGPERGTYQHPEFYGQPPEKGLNFDAAHGSRHSSGSLPALLPARQP